MLKSLNGQLKENIDTFDMDANGPYVCYAAQTNSIVIRANGTLAKCTVALSGERNSLGLLLDDGSLHFEDEKLKLWTRGLKSNDLMELKCPMYKLPEIKSQLHSIPVIVQS